MIDISFTQNRELSWLKFNERVLDEAADKTIEIFERLKFFAIFDSNLDEFFMVRVGSLTDIAKLNDQSVDTKSNLNAKEQLELIMKEVKRLYKKRDHIYEDLLSELKASGIIISRVSELNQKEKDYVYFYYNSKIAPILSFQIVDRIHPFPHLSNLSTCIVYKLKNLAKNSTEFMSLIKIPDNIRYIKVSDKKIILIDDLIKEFGDSIFDNYEVISKCTISLTRNADITYYSGERDIDEDFRNHIQKLLKKKNRLGAVRLEVNEEIDDDMKKFLLKNLDLSKKNLFKSKAPLRTSFIYNLLEDMPEKIIEDNSYKSFQPQDSYYIDDNVKMITQIEKDDVLLSYPYESIDPYIRLLEEAAEDKDVVSIKITIYRLAKHSRVAKALIKAAENGKEVVVLMELRARFDEENNIIWSSRLEEIGCRIIYGYEEYKCHSKVCLITKIEGKKIKYITQIGTGNYNEKTSKIYTDFSIMTTNQSIGKDAKKLFDNFLIGNVNYNYDVLAVSPKSMQDKLNKLIDREIKRQEENGNGYIRLKMNSISDRILIDKLSQASSKGVKIDLMIRGICCIIPGIKGKTENIRVYQIVGRFLEHHRVYQFGQRENCELYISSADFMTRNIRYRVEVACPIYSPIIKKRILDFLDLMFSDDIKIRKLNSDGNYERVEKTKGINAQEELIKQAITNANKQKNKSIFRMIFDFIFRR